MPARTAIPRASAAALLLLALATPGCGGDGDGDGRPAPAGAERGEEPAAPDRAGGRRGRDRGRPPRRRRRARRARCPAGAAGCASVRGRVVYVEAVDPDGDGDAHLVLSGGNVTGPGITAVAIRRELRPRRLPRVGDEVSAAGVVYRGSYGQRQIEADVLHVARR